MNIKSGTIEIRGCINKTSSLDAPIDEEGGNEIMDLVEDKSSSAHETALNAFFNKERLDGLLVGINEREHEILNLRFGLADGKTYTLAQVSKKMGVSRERIRQIEENALKKLKKVISEQDKETIE